MPSSMYACNCICPDKALISVCLCVCVYRAWIHCPTLFRAQTLWQALLCSTGKTKKKNTYTYISIYINTVCQCAFVTTVHSCLLLILLLLGQWGKSTSKLWIKRHHNSPGTVNSNSEYDVFVCDVFISLVRLWIRGVGWGCERGCAGKNEWQRNTVSKIL